MKTTTVRKPKRKAAVKSVSKTTLNKLRDEMRESARGIGSLYFHAEVVIDNFTNPADWSLITSYARETEFKNDGISQLSHPIYTLSASDKDRVVEQTEAFIKKLRSGGYAIHRYKIAEVFLDSNNWDTLKVL